MSDRDRQSESGVRPTPETIERRAVAVVQILEMHRGDGSFVSAADLASQIGLPAAMGHETRRRRIREAVRRARELLREQGAEAVLVANSQGYALTGDGEKIRSWLAGRRRAGLTDLVEVHRTERSPAVDAATGQTLLFKPQPTYRI
ncbi:MAG: hypothetical protein IT430_03980 [Phycisphaerales bacterium]|nr:hypothetical protein [Phycisphaerales bacterium]